MTTPEQLEFDFMRDIETEPITLRDVVIGLATLRAAVERSPVFAAVGGFLKECRDFDSEFQAALRRAQAVKSL